MEIYGAKRILRFGGKTLLFDPASYYGDRETDLAFTSMFGGFSSAFYEHMKHLPHALRI